MKLLVITLLLTSFSAKASAYFSTREQLRLQLWFHGLEVKEDKDRDKKLSKPKNQMPEELERSLKKL